MSFTVYNSLSVYKSLITLFIFKHRRFNSISSTEELGSIEQLSTCLSMLHVQLLNLEMCSIVIRNNFGMQLCTDSYLASNIIISSLWHHVIKQISGDHANNNENKQ